mmetsp:Transcript_61153/g.132577  ORF Transcript_61153/g.132577 Transcript_61153/m.132577 type:complete len:342 (+) Transcript_61153:836-1861(+)
MRARVLDQTTPCRSTWRCPLWQWDLRRRGAGTLCCAGLRPQARALLDGAAARHLRTRSTPEVVEIALDGVGFEARRESSVALKACAAVALLHGREGHRKRPFARARGGGHALPLGDALVRGELLLEAPANAGIGAERVGIAHIVTTLGVLAPLHLLEPELVGAQGLGLRQRGRGDPAVLVLPQHLKDRESCFAATAGSAAGRCSALRTFAQAAAVAAEVAAAVAVVAPLLVLCGVARSAAGGEHRNLRWRLWRSSVRTGSAALRWRGGEKNISEWESPVGAHSSLLVEEHEDHFRVVPSVIQGPGPHVWKLRLVKHAQRHAAGQGRGHKGLGLLNAVALQA